MSKYPIYIVSKGRAATPYTAQCFIRDGVKFQILVEPQEYDAYCASIGAQYVTALPFSNLGLGSYPARNHAWQLALENGHARHWVFDDNIRSLRRYHKGKKIACNAAKAIQLAEEFTDRYQNIGITAFQYTYFLVPRSSDRKPFYINQHCYSAMLMKTDMPYRWRLKYNEDVDLCLQVLHNGLCTVLLNALSIEKISTVAKLKGGNQDELYKGNAFEKKVLKARSLEEIWPQYVETVWKFNRPHHQVSWQKYFNQPLIRRTDINWDEIANRPDDMKLVAVGNVKSERLKKLIDNSLDKQPRNSHEAQTTQSDSR